MGQVLVEDVPVGEALGWAATVAAVITAVLFVFSAAWGWASKGDD